MLLVLGGDFAPSDFIYACFASGAFFCGVFWFLLLVFTRVLVLVTCFGACFGSCYLFWGVLWFLLLVLGGIWFLVTCFYACFAPSSDADLRRVLLLHLYRRSGELRIK